MKDGNEPKGANDKMKPQQQEGEEFGSVKHRQIGERASLLVITNLIDQIGLRAKWLIEIPRVIADGLLVLACPKSGGMSAPCTASTAPGLPPRAFSTLSVSGAKPTRGVFRGHVSRFFPV